MEKTKDELVIEALKKADEIEREQRTEISSPFNEDIKETLHFDFISKKSGNRIKVTVINESGESLSDFSFVLNSDLERWLSKLNSLSTDKAELETDLKTYLEAVNKLTSLFDFSKPMKAAAEVAKLLGNPEKFKDLLVPMGMIKDKYDQKFNLTNNGKKLN